jgi:hypothetical protein
MILFPERTDHRVFSARLDRARFSESIEAITDCEFCKAEDDDRMGGHLSLPGLD